MKRVALFMDTHKPDAISTAKNLIQWFNKKDVNVFTTKKLSFVLDMPDIGYDKEQLLHKVDWALTLGGDGTFLRWAHWISSSSLPLLGINLGTLGFLTEVKTSEVYRIWKRFLMEISK